MHNNTITTETPTVQKLGDKRDVVATLGLCRKRRLKSDTGGARKARRLPAGVIELLALGLLPTCDFKMFVFFLYLNITCATKHSGKTKLLEMLAGLVCWRLAT